MQNNYLKLLGGMVLILFLSFWGCTFNNEEEYFGKTECDTVDIIYSDLTFIFIDVCANCHTSPNPPHGILMDNYNNVKASFNTKLVLPAIKHTGDFHMPKSMDKLPDCDISKIEAWYNSGMPEKLP
jgi:hypothetical protein